MRIKILLLALAAQCALGQTALAPGDPLVQLNQRLLDLTDHTFHFTFEERTRWEEKDGVNFGKAVNQEDMLSRIRVGAVYQPVEWFSISAMGQDSRVPFYGLVAPNSIRDTMDLQEAYVELFPHAKAGFGAMFGRQMQSFGEGRLIGSPQWSNVSRTFDSGRISYKVRNARLEVLMLSPVKILPDKFNVPDLGERIWGTYNVFGKAWKGVSLDAYVLRHSQNKIGGWTGSGTLGTNSFGGRMYGALPRGFTYSLEGVGQTGHQGLLTQRAYAWYAGGARKMALGRFPAVASVEFKVASGTRKGSVNDGTFDQLSPANHDKFGHEDLFGWRNLRTLRSVETLNLTKTLAVNVMYSDEWLDSAVDGLYNSAGTAISVSKTGVAGTRVGQELDSYLTYQKGGHLFGAGFGHFFRGEFVEATTPRINPRYFYLFQQYSFK